MTVGWTPVFVLPNIPLDTAIGCDIAALAPADDHRIAALKRAHPMLRRFLNRFADNFGQKFEPAVLILNTAAPPIFREVSALANFRDLIALSAIAHGRATELRHPRGHRVLFGEAFAIYPWMLDRHYEDVVGSTPAILGMHQVSSFKGQSSPALFRTSLSESDIDQPLLTALMARWRRRYEVAVPAWEDVALMRSLNMAYHALLLPAGTDTTFYDIGRIVSLWVSAFEILVHPGGNGQANRDKVFEMIERTQWAIPASSQLAHDTGGKTKVKRTLASWLYQVLYECRNDFLHGNPVERTNLILPTPQRSIFEYAAPLYRIALTAFLPLTFGAPRPSADDPKAFGAHIVDHIDFMRPQKNAEEALLTATQPPAEHAGRHARITVVWFKDGLLNQLLGQLREPWRDVLDLNRSGVSSIVVSHGPKRLAEAIREHLLQLVIPAQYTRQSPATSQKSERVLGSEQVKVLPLLGDMLRKQQVILESGVLANRFCTASPPDEFELGDPQICFQVEFASGIPCAEGYILHPFIRFEDVGKAQQYTECMDRDVDLAS